jgi:putative endonuclease
MSAARKYNFRVHMLFNEKARAIRIGMTNDLEKRMIEHKMELVPGYTKKHNIKKLGYYEYHQYADKAIAREKTLKEWKRAWKYRLLETTNPEWKDLASFLDEYIAHMPEPYKMPDNAFANKGFKTLFRPSPE